MQDYLRTITSNIYAFCAALNFRPTVQQAEILDKVARGEKRIAIRSGQGVGKTAISVVIALFRALKSYQAPVLVTAPTSRQARKVWLAEAGRIIDEADPVFKQLLKVTATNIMICGDRKWEIATATATRPENLQGYHHPSLTCIIEEASGVSAEIFQTLMGTLTNKDSLLLAIGNPNTPTCEFRNCFYGPASKLWSQGVLNAEEIFESYPQIDAFDVERNHLLLKQFGRDSDVYRIRVLGEFPKQDPQSVMGIEELEAAIKTPINYGAFKRRKQIGLDFARFGGDENAGYIRSGNTIIAEFAKPNIEPIELIRWAFQKQEDYTWSDKRVLYMPDAGGIGQGLLHNFTEANKIMIPYHFGGKSFKPDYGNQITHSMFHIRNMLRSDDPAEHPRIPDDPELIRQLSSRKYATDLKGRLVVEPKDVYIKREGESPDRADAFCLAWHEQMELAG